MPKNETATKKADPELRALARIGRQLDGLDEGGRQRVLVYLLTKFGPTCQISVHVGASRAAPTEAAT